LSYDINVRGGLRQAGMLSPLLLTSISVPLLLLWKCLLYGCRMDNILWLYCKRC